MLTAPGKSADLVAYAVDHGLRRFSVDSPTDLDRVDGIAASRGVDVGCLLRVNADEPVPGMGLAMTGTSSQFGADASWVHSSPEDFLDRRHARVTGLHLYMGTNLTDEDTLVRQYDTAARLAARLSPRLGDVTEIDLGGGFGCPYARAGSGRCGPGCAAGSSASWTSTCRPGAHRAFGSRSSPAATSPVTAASCSRASWT
ncbi:hypothetical protein GCM10029964_053210 [Kibdelosporangium lantanae]